MEREERASEEKEVGDRRRRLGAGGEKEVRRGVGREFLSRSKVCLSGDGSHPTIAGKARVLAFADQDFDSLNSFQSITKRY